MTNHHSLLAGEWKLEAICGHVRGKLWWHVAARGKKNPKGTNTEENGFGKLKYEITCDDKLDDPTTLREKKKNEMSVEFEIPLKDVRLVLNENDDDDDDDDDDRGGCFSRVIFLTYFWAMKMSLRAFQLVARFCLPKKKLSEKMLYSGTYGEADAASSDGTTFDKPILFSRDEVEDGDFNSIGCVQHDIVKCSDNIKAFTQKEMRSRHLTKDVEYNKLLLVREFHLNKDKNILMLVLPNDSTSKKPGMQLKWRRIR